MGFVSSARVFTPNISLAVIPFRSSMTLTHKVDQNKLTLSCATAHLPSSSVVWQRDNIVVSRLETRTELTDVANAGYSNNLDVVWNSNGVSKVSCEVFTEWKTPDQPYYDSVGKCWNVQLLMIICRLFAEPNMPHTSAYQCYTVVTLLLKAGTHKYDVNTT